MSFLSGALNKSVFNQGTFAAAIGNDKQNGYAVVRITPNSARLGLTTWDNKFKGGEEDPAIKGVFDFEKGTFGFGVEANWASLGDIGGAILPGATNMVKGVFEKLNAGANLAGAAEVGAGLASQLIYQKSGYLEIKIPMMIVDWNGTGQPVLCALLLSRYCLPSFILNGKDEVEKGVDKLKESLQNTIDDGVSSELAKAGAKTTLGLIEGVKAGVDLLKEGLEKAGDFIPATKEIATKSLENVGGIDDAYILRSSPSDVKVEIGRFFKNEKMVITGVSFEFSKEMTRKGPLYVNIDISLKSRRILTSIGDIGLILPNNGQNRYLTAGTNATGL